MECHGGNHSLEEEALQPTCHHAATQPGCDRHPDVVNSFAYHYSDWDCWRISLWEN